jgi:hypothetical protein
VVKLSRLLKPLNEDGNNDIWQTEMLTSGQLI